MKIAFVYDWFDTPLGGAERVLGVLHEMYPDAPWYTTHSDRGRATWAAGWDIRPSFLQKLPLWFRRNRILTLLLMPFAFESFDLAEYDTVISVSSGFAKNVITTANSRHICYLLTPPRWAYKFQVPSSKFQVISKIINAVKNYLVNWDWVGAASVDEYISISQEVARRCKEFYGRESEVLYPPFEYDKWKMLSKNNNHLALSPMHSELKKKEYFLVVSRLEPYKRVDLAIEAFSKFINKQEISPSSTKSRGRDDDVGTAKSRGRDDATRFKLVIVGKGSQKIKLQASIANSQLLRNVIWLEKVTDEELATLYANAIALVMPQEEDFGYTACEAVACGCPVVAYSKGGQIEIIENGATGVYFDKQTPGGIAAALEEVQKIEYNLKTYENCNIRGWSRHTFMAAFSQKIPQTV